MLVCGAGWWYWHRPAPAAELPVYKVGYGTFPPYFVMPKDAPPTGFAVEVVREAARRIGMPLEWKRYSETTDKALMKGELDLFPMLAMIPSRMGKVEFSEPWWENTLVVVSRQESPIRTVADTKGKPISLIHASFGLQRMKALFPEAVPVTEREYENVVRNVCSGKADGAIIETRLATGLSLLPQCAQVELTMAWFPDLNLTYGVGARKGLKPAADRLQAEIVRMAQDGTMTRIGEPWGVQVTNQKKLLDSLVQGKMREQWWRDMVVASVLLLLLAGAQGFRLRQARRKAEEALAARSQFVANISHEIRTPLNGLLGMTQVLRETPLDPAQKDCAEIMDTTGQTLLALINELLDYSKLEAGKLELEAIVFSPAKVAAGVTHLFERQASSKGLELVCEVDESIPATVVGDPGRLRQVLNNLVSNAVKFTAHGSVRLRVLPAGGSLLRFEVVDTGCGVASALRKRIFEPFTQADGSTSRKHGGTGLGLAICKDLTTLLGGTIGMESAPDKGSVFWVELPFEKAPGSNVPDAAAAPDRKDMLGLHVLVAEDNVVNQHVLLAHLRKLGCTWTLTANGQEALDAAGRERFDAVLMDGQMPEMDGFVATEKIRRLPKPFGDVRVIGVTACAFEQDRRRCLDAGMQSVLTKPFTTAGLRAELEKRVSAS